MARVYSVTYDLRQPGRSYQPLYDELKNSTRWWHYLQSTWLIYTDETATQLTDRLRAKMDNNDYVLVIRVCDDRDGWLPKDAWEWITSYVPNC